MTTVTATQVPVTVGSATLVGREWIVDPLMPWSGDASPEAATYISRNTGKTRTVNVWSNVRYAEAPVGALRWKEAVDYDYPTGTYQCDTLGNVSPQVYSIESGTNGRPEWGSTSGAANWRAQVPGGTKEDEDCLNLTIYAPDGTPPAGGWPVVYFIHGGGWNVNSANAYQSRGHRLATKGVIVVLVEYRLGSLGFFYHPDFEGEAGWNGPNFAYSDIKSGLRWVNRNISAFGGNASKVLISGTSAGGAAVLALMEDATVSSLFASAWVCSGGGLGHRYAKAIDSWTPGYERFFGKRTKAATVAAAYLRDYSDTSRRVSDAMMEHGDGHGLRLGLSVDHVLSLTQARDRITRSSLQAGTAAYAFADSINVFPMRGNGIAYRSAVDAAKDTKLLKPLLISACENEATVAGDYASWSDATTSGYTRNLNLEDYDQWQKLAWINGGWSATEHRRLIYNHSAFQYPAWRIARAMFTTASATAYLMLWGFSGASTADHSTDIHYLFGNVEWNVGMSGAEAKVTARMLEMADGMMQLFANMAANQNPNTAYSSATDFDLFATPPAFTVTAYDTASEYHWNVAGSVTAGGAGTAPIAIANTAYFGGAWADYLSRLG